MAADAKTALQPVIALSGVSKHYRNGTQRIEVLKDINLTLHAGVMVAITGQSGSGKSTLLNILGCLDRPSQGRYRVAGRDTRTLSSNGLANLRRRHFGFIFQRYHLLSGLSALQNVELPAVYSGLPATTRRRRAGELLSRLGLRREQARHPNQLSGGQQQRVAIARALMNGGRIILADEPTGALDSETGRDTLQQLLALRDQGYTVIVVTHDPAVAACAERVIELADGRIVSDRPNPAAPSTHAATPTAAPQRKRTPQGRPGRIVEALEMAWRAMLAHRLRTLLTMLGIIIGIASVVAIMAVGEGNRRHIEQTIGVYAGNIIEIRRGQGWDDTGARAIHTLREGDVDVLRSQPFAELVTPLTRGDAPVRFRDRSISALVNGVAKDYLPARGLTLAEGRSFSADDIARQAQVVIIDSLTRQRLFASMASPVGQSLVINNAPFTVIGVLSASGQELFSAGSPNVLLPYSTAGIRLFGRSDFDAILVRLARSEEAELAEQSIVRLLSFKHGSKDFFINNMNTLAEAYAATTRSLSLTLALVASIALLVGGVGVMNIMLVSVSERTREIGIRMAIGARRSDILRQFLTESVAICLIGGICGILLALLTGPLFSAFVKEWRMAFSSSSVLLAFTCSTLVGIAFGYWPARKGADLSPAVALNRD